MQTKEKKRNTLGRYVFLALVLGLISGQLLRSVIVDANTLKYIAGEMNMVAGLFLRLIKMIIAPLVFSTLIVGIGKLGDASALGRMFFKAMLIFIVGGFISLLIGLCIVDFFQPGKVLAQALLTHYSDAVNGANLNDLNTNLTVKGFLEEIIPASITESFAKNNVIQIVVFSIFFGIAGVSIGKQVEPVFDFFELVSKIMFKVTTYTMLFAPIAVFTAVSAIIIESGYGIISSYFLYIAEFMFSVVILWLVMIFIGYFIIGKRVFYLVRVLADSLGIAFSTASSEAVLPSVFEELDKFGIRSRVSGFVLPLGYSFNLVGSMLNCIFATMFIIQIYGYHLTTAQKITMLFMLMITSKGIAGIPRASLVIVAATLTSMGIPESALLILFPVDGFFDMARSATNVFANALSAAVVDKWEKNK